MKKYIFLFTFLFTINLFAQNSGRDYRKYNILNKNQVKTVFTNGGVIGHPVGDGPRGAWQYDNNGYLGDVSPFVGCEIPVLVNRKDISDSTYAYFHSVTYCLADHRPNTQEQSKAGEFWGFEPEEGYYNKQKGDKTDAVVALYTDPTTWPESWPDKQDDINDPGWDGEWNGYFGKDVSNATEETFFVMNDDKDKEFNFANNNLWKVSFKPDSNNTNHNGMALEVAVRAMQWNQFLAQDCIFWLYEITNKGTTNYNKATFGMLVGTYVGVTSTEDFNEYDDDWSFFDAERNVTYTGDFPDRNNRNPLWTGPVGMVGYAFLESPSNAFDGIDNDNDNGENNTIAEANVFTPEDFDSVLIDFDDQVVLIDQNYNRSVVTITGDTTVYSLGQAYTIIPGVTKLVEGNVIITSGGIQTINENATDGYDNDLDGIIDENYFLHYRQRRQDPKTGQILIDKLRPLSYINFKTGDGLNDLMLDEARNDGIDNNNDWNSEYDDVGLDGKAETGDFGELDGQPTSGYQFGLDTGLPGEPHIDKTDVRESDQIGLTSFVYFTNAQAGETILTDDEAWWDRVAPGIFNVPSSIQNNEPVQGEDGDFFYASGFFPLMAKQTERFSIALVYGGGKGGWRQDLADLLINLETVQKIYDSNYQFPKPPDTPTLNAEAGDGQVILTWDRVAESSFDPVLREYDFEGYRLYKSSDPLFTDIHILTDAYGKISGYKPLDQWDLIDDIKDVFHGSAELSVATRGYSWNLGDDTGLKHYYVDTDVENGRIYYYALTAYDKGDADRDIFPAESPFSVTIFSSGEVKTDQNTVRVIPSPNTIGYVPSEKEGLVQHISGPADGTINYQVIDEKNSLGHTYLVQFEDISNDGLDNDGDWNITTDDLNKNSKPDSDEPHVDKNDPDEFWPTKTSNYSVKDLTEFEDEIFIADTIKFVNLSHTNIDTNTVIVERENGEVLNSKAFELDAKNGRIRPNKDDESSEMDVQATYYVKYKYFAVYKSTHLVVVQDDEDAGKLFDTDLFDGTQLSINNYNSVGLIDTASGWSRPNGYSFTFSVVNVPNLNLYGRKTPNNFRIDFFNNAVKNSLDTLSAPALPINFTITNTLSNEQIPFIFIPVNSAINDSGFYELTPQDEIYFFEQGLDNKLYYTWYFQPILQEGQEQIHLRSGDYLDLIVSKPFRNGDEFMFTTTVPTIDKNLAKDEMDMIKVVPNPYVSAHAHEAPLPPLKTSGRGERKITFIHIPSDAKISIFTASGGHVITIRNENPDPFTGSMSWNLKNKYNLDIAYGIYFYVVESKLGTKKGKIAIIK